MHILLVEENGTSNENDEVQKGLKQNGYTVDRRRDGKALVSFIKTEKFEVILLDLSLSPTLGISILREIRAEGIKTPVLVFTSYLSHKDTIQGLDSGADDYLTKPVNLDELSARIRALHRRSYNLDSPPLTYQDIELNPSSLTVRLKGQFISFTRQEFSLLQKLLENVGHVVSFHSMNECLYGYGWARDIKSNTIEVHVHNIRKKLNNTDCIRTIRGIGYMIKKENI